MFWSLFLGKPVEAELKLRWFVEENSIELNLFQLILLLKNEHEHVKYTENVIV